MTCLHGMSQESMTFKYADSLTYRLYLDKNWSELIRTGRDAIETGHDYYYMRMRLGIAYYEMHNYGMSTIHFKKALVFNTSDPVALEYLFYSYYLSGRNYEAWAVVSRLYRENRERILAESGIQKNSLTIETFYSNAATEEIISQSDEYFSNHEAGSQIVTRQFINNAIYATHIIGKNTAYFHAYTNLIKDNYLHFFDGSYTVDMPDQRVVQNQYYGNFNFFFSSGWSVGPSFHFLTSTYPMVTINYYGMNPFSTTYSVRTNGFAGGLRITKSGGFVTIYGETGFSSLNYSRQIQGTLSLMIYPAGNRNIYLGGKFSVVTGVEKSDSDLRLVTGFLAGFSIRNRVWFEFSGLTGEMKNYTDNNGLIVNNSTDILTGKYNANVIVPFYKAGISLFAGAGISSNTSEFIPADGVNSYDSNKLDYNTYILTGGISWKF